MITALILHERSDDELLLLSATREAANTTFSIAAGMVRADPDLAAVLWARDNIKSIEHRVNHNVLKIVSLDSNSLAGKRASYVLVDELWLLGGMAKAESALQEGLGGLSSRKEGWAIYLSTQSDEPPAGVFKEKLRYARQVRDGEIDDPAFLPVLYELPEGFDYAADIEGALERVNPNIDASVSRKWLLAEYKKAKGRTDGGLQRYLSKHLNVEIGLALRSDRWSGCDYWEEQEIELTLDELIKRSEVICLGVDGGALDDWLALTVMGRDAETKCKLSWTHAWCAEIALQRREQIAPTARGFADDGDLTIVPEIGEDIEQLADIVSKVYASGKLDQIGLDPAGIGQILEAIQQKGVPESYLVGVSQGWKLGSAIAVTERWLAQGELTPAAQPMMRWTVANCRVEPRGNAILITKQASGRSKIDGAMSLFDAAALMAQNPEAKQTKVSMFSL
jgi:phage terminase large subunit-like protein